MANKRKWEVEYEKLASEDIDAQIKNKEIYLDNNRKIKKEYYTKAMEELKYLKMMKGNLSKVKNILELRDKLAAQRKEIITEIENREKYEKDKLEKERIELEKEYDELYKKLNTPYLDKKSKEELKTKIKENQAKRNENYNKTLVKIEKTNEK